jgi:membrane-associated phospholipid phosphatase
MNRNRNLDPVARRVSQSAVWLSAGIPCATAALGSGLALLSGSALCLGSVQLIKSLAARPRPFLRYPEIQPPYGKESGYAFPSGHTAAAFATATEITLLKPRWYVAGPAFLWAGAVGWSRMHLGQHSPGDVLAGALTGSACAWLGWQVRRWWSARPGRFLRFRKRKPGASNLPPYPGLSFSGRSLLPPRPLSRPSGEKKFLPPQLYARLSQPFRLA